MRLFVGIALPSEAIDQIAAIQNGIPGALWSDKMQLHMTLRFIGSVDSIIAEEIVSMLGNISKEAFSIRLEGVGYFGSSRNLRMLWVGAQQCQALLSLHGSIQAWLLRAGIMLDRRKFIPHITIARLRNPSRARLRKFFESTSLFRTQSFKVDCFHLYSSHQSRKGSVYRIEETYNLNSP